MKIRSIAALTLIAMLVGTAPARADYPPTFQQNDKVVSAGQALGFTVADNNTKLAAGTFVGVRRVVPSTTPKPSVLPNAKVGQPLAPTAIGLPNKADVVLKVIIDGKYVVLGTAKTSATGSIRFPAIKFKNAGTYIFFALLADGQAVKMKITVK